MSEKGGGSAPWCPQGLLFAHGLHGHRQHKDFAARDLGGFGSSVLLSFIVDVQLSAFKVEN